MTTAGLKLEVRVAWWLKPAVRWLIFKARFLNAIGRLDEAGLADLMDQGERLAKSAVGVRDWRRVRPWYIIGLASLFPRTGSRGQ